MIYIYICIHTVIYVCDYFQVWSDVSLHYDHKECCRYTFDSLCKPWISFLWTNPHCHFVTMCKKRFHLLSILQAMQQQAVTTENCQCTFSPSMTRTISNLTRCWFSEEIDQEEENIGTWSRLVSWHQWALWRQEKALPDTTMPDKDEKESSYSLTGRAQSGTAYHSIVQTSVERTIVRLQLGNSKSFCFVSDIASGPMDCLKHLKLSGEN